jgi:hypothetical protein
LLWYCSSTHIGFISFGQNKDLFSIKLCGLRKWVLSTVLWPYAVVMQMWGVLSSKATTVLKNKFSLLFNSHNEELILLWSQDAALKHATQLKLTWDVTFILLLLLLLLLLFIYSYSVLRQAIDSSKTSSPHSTV